MVYSPPNPNPSPLPDQIPDPSPIPTPIPDLPSEPVPGSKLESILSRESS